MRASTLVALAAAAFVMSDVAALPHLAWAGQAAPKARQRRWGRGEREIANDLAALADAIVKGRPTGGDAWLKWQNHFLRAADGRTYVPFTIRLDEARAGFQQVGLYVRVTERGDTQTSVERVKHMGGVGFRTGDVPVSVPERQFSRGAPTAGEASAALRLAEESQKVQQIYPYEDVQFFELPPGRDGELRLVRRAITVGPGSYDVYVAIRERSGSPPKSANLKYALDVPDFSKPGLTMSSLILADRIDLLNAPLSAEEQMARPYALGTAEIVPAADATLGREETLTVVLIVYNAATDARGKPDVAVDYVFFQQVGVTEQQFTRTAPQRFAADTLPPAFDLQRGHQLAPAQTVPLQSFSPGAYRLEVRVTDHLASASITRDLRFAVVDTGTRH